MVCEIYNTGSPIIIIECSSNFMFLSVIQELTSFRNVFQSQKMLFVIYFLIWLLVN